MCNDVCNAIDKALIAVIFTACVAALGVGLYNMLPIDDTPWVYTERCVTNDRLRNSLIATFEPGEVGRQDCKAYKHQREFTQYGGPSCQIVTASCTRHEK